MYSPYFPKLTEPEDILRFMDEEAIRVILEIPYSGVADRVTHLAYSSKVHKAVVPMILKEFKKLGLVELTHLHQFEENYLCGSGYYLTPLGREVAELVCPPFDPMMRLNP